MTPNIMKCPRDKNPLKYNPGLPLGTHECSRCEGVMVNADKLPAIRALKQAKILSLKCSKLECPSCSYPMREFIYRGIEIDICPKCKTVWLDPNEDEVINSNGVSTLDKEKGKWYDQLDPVSPAIDFVSMPKNSCTSDDSSILEFLGEAIVSLLDGI